MFQTRFEYGAAEGVVASLRCRDLSPIDGEGAPTARK